MESTSFCEHIFVTVGFGLIDIFPKLILTFGWLRAVNFTNKWFTFPVHPLTPFIYLFSQQNCFRKKTRLCDVFISMPREIN